MTYACPAWRSAADIHLIKLQRLQNRILRAIGHIQRRTPIRNFHVAFQIPYVYDSITKTCSKQADVTRNHDTVTFES
jgi:hypothetical protein